MLLRLLLLASKFVVLIVTSAVIAGCNSSTAPSSNYAPFSGVDLVLGSGTEAAAGNQVTVKYTGWFYDLSKQDRKGAMFDSSGSGAGLTFILGAGQVIAGWDLGIQGMKVGGVRRLVIPPSLGYGSSRVAAIPPYATLLFDVELTEVVVAEGQ